VVKQGIKYSALECLVEVFILPQQVLAFIRVLSQTTNLPLRWLKYRGFFGVAGLNWVKHVMGRKWSYMSVRIVEFAK
jgi:hypothetical protein